MFDLHDEHELVGGDFPLQLKLDMSEEEKAWFKEGEVSDAKTVARAYPKQINGYNIFELLLHMIFKDVPGAQLGSVLDKIDGFCEAIHETLAGNFVFLEPWHNYLEDPFNNLPEHYPLIKDLFPKNHKEQGNPFIMPPCKLYDFFEGGKRPPTPHTLETLALPTGIPIYDMWKGVTIETPDLGVGLLIDQVEFSPPRVQFSKF
jgi:hypothetical protein